MVGVYMMVGTANGMTMVEIGDLIPDESVSEVLARAEQARKDGEEAARRYEERLHVKMAAANAERREKRLRAIAGGEEPKCVTCGETDIDRLSVDHILARSRGGTNALSNLQLLCRSCNSSKGAKPMDQWLAARTNSSAP